LPTTDDLEEACVDPTRAPAERGDLGDVPSAPHGKGEHGALDNWQRNVWAGVAFALAAVVLVLIMIMAYTLNMAQQVFAQHVEKDRVFTFTGMALIASTLLRLLAIFFGAALSFGGLVVSFYVHEHSKPTNASGGYAGLKASLSTNSPGIAAILVGSVIVIAALFATGDFDFQPDSSGSAGQSAAKKPSSSSAGAQTPTEPSRSTLK
jgi:hypothetical protein